MGRDVDRSSYDQDANLYWLMISPGERFLIGNGMRMMWLSWVNSRTHSVTTTAPSTMLPLLTRKLADNELEAGRSVNVELRARMGYRSVARPVSGPSGLSTCSATSVNTFLYEAQSEGLSHSSSCTMSSSRYGLYRWEGTCYVFSPICRANVRP